jgi:hypothetical protein
MTISSIIIHFLFMWCVEVSFLSFMILDYAFCIAPPHSTNTFSALMYLFLHFIILSFIAVKCLSLYLEFN